MNWRCTYMYKQGTIHLVRTHRRGVGGSSAMRTPMYCCHSDVIICAYRGGSGWVWNLEIGAYVIKWMAPNRANPIKTIISSPNLNEPNYNCETNATSGSTGRRAGGARSQRRDVQHLWLPGRRLPLWQRQLQHPTDDVTPRRRRTNRCMHYYVVHVHIHTDAAAVITNYMYPKVSTWGV